LATVGDNFLGKLQCPLSITCDQHDSRACLSEYKRCASAYPTARAGYDRDFAHKLTHFRPPARFGLFPLEDAAQTALQAWRLTADLTRHVVVFWV
jgi:hypothetical protein